jgi:hypothetical protein
MAKLRKIGRVTFRELTNEEALQEYGSSLVFVGRPINAQRAEEVDLKGLPRATPQ